MKLGLGRFFDFFDNAVRLFVGIPTIELIGSEVPANLRVLRRAVNLAMPIVI